ncbi:MAG: hypothetical protein JWR85_4199 [Marmoricola sp.]|nr:hypothetical protein [Marmoricola sp.]
MALSKPATVNIIAFLHAQGVKPANIVRLLNYEYENLDDVFSFHQTGRVITYEKILDSGARIPVWVGKQ